MMITTFSVFLFIYRFTEFLLDLTLQKKIPNSFIFLYTPKNVR